MANRNLKHPSPRLLPLSPDKELEAKVKRAKNRFADMTLGDLDLVASVSGLEETREAQTLLILPYDPEALKGLERGSVRVFRHDARSSKLRPVWSSGINLTFRFVWAKVQRPGTYLPIGLPRDRLLQESLRALACERCLRDVEDPEADHELTRRFLRPFFGEKAEALEELRDFITRFEIGTTTETPLEEYNFGEGGHPLPFHLPRGDRPEEFRERLEQLEVLPGGLPEEQLFRPPEPRAGGEGPWAISPEARWDLTEPELVAKLPELKVARLPELEVFLPWLVSKNWPMYQHDARHFGAASGGSSINSTTVGQLTQRFKVNLDGPVNSKPSIVDGNAYIGTSRYQAGPGGTLYKIDLCSGCIEGKFPTPADPAHYSIHGIGGSPAIYKGKAYFTTVAGKVYCVDVATMKKSAPHPSALWVTDLKNPSAAKKQPVDNPSGDCWSSPLVVNNKVYVGSGEGEVSTCWGFTWCLDATTGEVLWLFCTNKAKNINAPGNENKPNEIPRSAAVSDPLPPWATAAGFSLIDDPPETGSSPWSSFAYDGTLQRVYVGTGNSQYPQTAAPDQRYGSGLLALDANTGQFRGFHTSQTDDSYWPGDVDIDVPGAPTIFHRGGERVVCYGSKNGSFFLLDPANLQVLGGGAQRRQLLARENGSGHPGNRGNPIPSVVPTPGGSGENKYGVMATPAVHAGLGKIFVGLGGYSGAGDGTKSPFLRAVDWNNLNDAWPTALGGDGVTRYTTANPPVYQEANEAGLSSPAVVNDVVFVSTTNPAQSEMSLYALDAATGLCLWAAPKVPGGGWPRYALGPAISGEYVAAAAGDALYVYTRPGTPWCLCLLDPPDRFFQERFFPWPPELIPRLGG